MRKPLLSLVAVLGLAACATQPMGPPPPPPSRPVAIALPPYVAAALSDPSRPAADMVRDKDRHPGEVLAFTGVKPGGKVADLIPGGGYFTRIFSKAVGPRGRVYAYVPDELTKLAKREPAVNAIARDPAFSNVTVILNTLPNFSAPEKLDLVFTAQNYHDMHDKFMGPADLSVVNRQIFRALKPGGVFLVIDHSAEPGSGLRDTETLHRIDSAVVKSEVTAAGFIFEGESRVLRDSGDSRKANVFDPSIRGRTDQFVYKFRKPSTAR
ncbi:MULTISPECIES: class I SAM-dependent methyltransferase [unclassified Caulobacter]|jgi:predicted methyltransferase|uniref:class I SAM-dependent methyltransferase n=1 Tax=unclassified Caulobacter TaxID=2648921 RepID=UPI0006F52C73|nr:MULTISPECIES: class I SAM-dependent methyltransferase [unclassified Caulobacter]KQV56964.1 methyltransferase [Caulobacter sp. Root342]KQV66450.1 methyltransferase [Caulobacter sp. Root343]